MHTKFRIIWSVFSIHESRGIAYWGEFEFKLKKSHCLQKFSLTTSQYFAHILRYTYRIEVIQVALETRFKELRNSRSHVSFRCLKLKLKPFEVDPSVQEQNQSPMVLATSVAVDSASTYGFPEPYGRAQLCKYVSWYFLICTLLFSKILFSIAI